MPEQPLTNMRLFPFVLHCPKCEWYVIKTSIADEPEAMEEYERHYQKYHRCERRKCHDARQGLRTAKPKRTWRSDGWKRGYDEIVKMNEHQARAARGIRRVV